MEHDDAVSRLCSKLGMDREEVYEVLDDVCRGYLKMAITLGSRDAEEILDNVEVVKALADEIRGL